MIKVILLVVVCSTKTTKSLVNPNEFEAIKAPAWLGGVYAVGGGRSLFNGRKEDKGFKIKLEKDNEDDKWDNKIYYPSATEGLQERIAGRRSLKHIDQAKDIEVHQTIGRGNNNPGL